MSIDSTYNFFLVALSFCVSAFGSYTGLQLVRGIRTAKEGAKLRWVIASALALGGGAIWAMHFIGMIAFDIGIPIAYDPIITFASLMIAVIVVGCGIFFLSTRQQSIAHLIGAGTLTGIGVACMHYAGMFAMNSAADFSYNMPIVWVSVGIAVVAATAALWLAFNLEGTMQMIGASIVMAIAVCGMHYIGMHALEMVANPNKIVPDTGIKPLTLGLLIFCFSMMLLVLCLIVTLSQLNRRMYEALEEDDEFDEEHEGHSAGLSSTS